MVSTLAWVLLVRPGFSASGDTAPATTLGFCSPPCLLFPCLLYPLEWIIWGRGHVRGRRVQLRVELVAWTYQEEAVV